MPGPISPPVWTGCSARSARPVLIESSVLPFVRVPVRKLSQGVHKDTQTQERRGGQVHRLFDARAWPVTGGLAPYQHRIIQALSIGSFDAMVPDRARQTDRQTDRHTDRQTDRQTETDKGRPGARHTGRNRQRWMKTDENRPAHTNRQDSAQGD